MSERPIGALPSALDDFASLEARLGGRRAAVFLDYDGTLTPIVDRPDMAILSPEARAVVAALARRLPVAVISGRDRADVERLVGVDGLVYAGSHGFDIRLPDGRELRHEAAGDVAPLLDRAARRLERALSEIPGALIERKRFSLAAHYRLVAPARAAAVRAAVDDALAAEPGRLKVKPGKMVFEVQPAMDWDKGKALLWLLRALGLDDAGVAPLFLGDDVTDEDAFAVLRDRGVGIVVAAAHEVDGRATRADFRLADPGEVLSFLRRLEGLR